MSEPAWVPLGAGAPVDVGPEVAYAEYTAPVTITASTEATAQTVATAPAFVADGSSQYMVEFNAPVANPAGTSGSYIQFSLWLDGVDLGVFGMVFGTSATALQVPVRCARRLTPAAGSRVFSVRAHLGAAGTGNVQGGVGGAGAYLPGFIRITKVPVASQVGLGGASIVPSGVLCPYAGSVVPSGYLLCDGSAISRTTFASLFAAIGTGYGVGDGSTTFNLPDLQGRVPVGVGTNAAVNALNKNDGVALANRRPQHRHTPHAHTLGTSAGFGTGGFTGVQSPFNAAAQSVNASDGGSGVAADSLDAPAFVTVNYIIKT